LFYLNRRGPYRTKKLTVLIKIKKPEHYRKFYKIKTVLYSSSFKKIETRTIQFENLLKKSDYFCLIQQKITENDLDFGTGG
jgi:hypothetical protein